MLALATEFVKTLEKNFMTTNEEDEELIEKAQKYETKAAIQLRMDYK